MCLAGEGIVLVGACTLEVACTFVGVCTRVAPRSTDRENKEMKGEIVFTPRVFYHQPAVVSTAKNFLTNTRVMCQQHTRTVAHTPW